MNSVTYLKDIKKPDDVKIIEMEEVVNMIKGTDLMSITSQLHILKKGELNSADIEKRKEYADEYKRLKNTLENVVFSGEFSQRNNNSCTLYWARVVLDIDHIKDEKSMAIIKGYFKKKPYVELIFKSPSAKGLKVVCKVAYKGEKNIIDFHKKAFLALKEEHDKFLTGKHGTEIDKSGKDLSRTCYLCHDDKVYYNMNADAFSFEYNETVEREVRQKMTDTNKWYKQLKEDNEVENEVLLNDMLNFIDNNNVDLTGNYEDWVSIMWTLKWTLGEELGYQYFDRFSSRYPGYSREETKNKWDENPLDPTRERHSLGTLIFLLKKHGYRMPKEIKSKSIFWNEMIEKLWENRVVIRFESDSKRYQIGRNRKWENMTDRDDAYIRINVLEGRISMSDLYNLIASISPEVSQSKEFLRKLPVWDGVDRIKQLADTITIDDEFVSLETRDMYVRKWMIGAVAQLHNTLENKKVNENIIILNGPQYIGKTRWCKALMPDGYKEFFDMKDFDFKDKDHKMLLSERWVILMDEGVSLKKSDIRELKTLLSTDHFTERLPYGRRNETFTRYASFISSTNEMQILTDDTGNRRFWVLPVTHLNYEHTIDMSQVWSQALKHYKDGEQYWLTNDELASVNETNKPFEIENEIDYYVKKYIVESNTNQMLTTEILNSLRGVMPDDVARRVEVFHLGKSLNRLGFKRRSFRRDGRVMTGYSLEFVSNGIMVNDLDIDGLR